MYDKGGRNIQWKKDSFFNKWCWENWTATSKRIKLDYFLTPYIKIQSRSSKNLNESCKTIKLLEENIGSTLFEISLSKNILDLTSKARETKAKINKWDCIKIKRFCLVMETINKTKKPAY